MATGLQPSLLVISSSLSVKDLRRLLSEGLGSRIGVPNTSDLLE